MLHSLLYILELPVLVTHCSLDLYADDASYIVASH